MKTQTKLNQNQSDERPSFSAFFSERDVAKIKEWNEEFPNSKQVFERKKKEPAPTEGSTAA